MLPVEYDEFKTELADLCAAHDKPLTDERLRVFWRVLKEHPFPLIKSIMRKACASTRFPRPIDLKPEESSRPKQLQLPKLEFEPIAAHAQKCMFAYLAKHGSATPEALQAMIAEKNRRVTQLREIFDEDKTLTGTEIRDALFRAWDQVWVSNDPAEHDNTMPKEAA